MPSSPRRERSSASSDSGGGSGPKAPPSDRKADSSVGGAPSSPACQSATSLAGKPRDRLPRRLAGRLESGAHRRRLGPGVFRQPHRLQQGEALGLVAEQLDQSTRASPAIAGHVVHIPSYRRDRTASSVKELMPAYRPKKRDSTAVNKYSPRPGWRSSTARVNCRPRQKPRHASSPTRRTTRRLSRLSSA